MMHWYAEWTDSPCPFCTLKCQETAQWIIHADRSVTNMRIANLMIKYTWLWEEECALGWDERKMVQGSLPQDFIWDQMTTSLARTQRHRLTTKTADEKMLCDDDSIWKMIATFCAHNADMISKLWNRSFSTMSTWSRNSILSDKIRLQSICQSQLEKSMGHPPLLKRK